MFPHSDELSACIQCGYCTNACPIYKEIGWESSSPRGKVYWLKQYMQNSPMDFFLGKKEINKEFVRRMYQCTMCGRCAEVCHVEIKFSEYWEDIREWLASTANPPENHAMMHKSILSVHNPFNEAFEKRTEWCSEYKSKNAELVFFTGCVISYQLFKLGTTILKILEKCGIEFSVLGGREWCCGNPLALTGQTDILWELGEHNISAIEGMGAKRIVTPCPGCYKTFKNTYPKKVGKPGFEVLHISQLLKEIIDENKLSFKKEFKGNVIYHDPCELGRLCGIYEEPRKVLENIPGLKLIEFSSNRRLSNCCGAGGALKAIENELSLKIAEKKINEAIENSADYIASSCPSCRFNLNQAAIAKKKEEKERGKTIKLDVLDICEIVGRLV
ncbi:MAG: (Fe-S)-binding protein [Candidatus Thermoplasmatota archaeon]